MRFPKGRLLHQKKKRCFLNFLACFFQRTKKKLPYGKIRKRYKKTSDVSLLSDWFFVGSCHGNGCFERKHLLYISLADVEGTLWMPTFLNMLSSLSHLTLNWVFPKNKGTPKSSILIRFSIINHPFWGTFILGNTQLYNSKALRLNSRIITVSSRIGCQLSSKKHPQIWYISINKNPPNNCTFCSGKKKTRNNHGLFFRRIQPLQKAATTYPSAFSSWKWPSPVTNPQLARLAVFFFIQKKSQSKYTI